MSDAPGELGGLVRHLRAALEAAGKPDAALEARLIVEHVTGAGRSDMVLDPQRHVRQEQVAAALAVLQRRLEGAPLHRIFGVREFYGMPLRLSAETLEPRPDTEALVDLALPLVRRAVAREGACRILDLGTGTGAVALALLREEPRASAVATDISQDALATATRNADMNGHGRRFEAVRSNWFDAIDGMFHVIVSNPPYIPTIEIELLEREVRKHDPIAALDGGPDGLDAYRAIAAGASHHLQQNGSVAVEIGYDQAEAVEAIFASEGFRLVEQAADLGGVTRALAFDFSAR